MGVDAALFTWRHSEYPVSKSFLMGREILHLTFGNFGSIG